MNEAEHVEMTTQAVDGAVIVQPRGEIDLSRSPSFRQQIQQAQSDRSSRLIIDLSEVPYMDSSGVATLVEAMQVARRTGTTLILCGLQEKVRSIFEIARLDVVFTIVEDCDAALSQ